MNSSEVQCYEYSCFTEKELRYMETKIAVSQEIKKMHCVFFFLFIC